LTFFNLKVQKISSELFLGIDDTFRKQPRDAIAAVGQSVTIECQGPRGIPEPDITWRKDDALLSHNDRIRVSLSNTIKVKHV